MMETSIHYLKLGLFFLVLMLFSLNSYAEVIVVGVRTDAAPFSYKKGLGPAMKSSGQGPLQAKGYDGYVVHICDAALMKLQARADDDLMVEVVEVDAQSRLHYFKERSGGKRIDVLCDALTVTKERLNAEEFGNNGLLASSPVYLSGVSFAKLPTPLWPSDKCPSILGVVKETTAEASGVGEILDSGAFGVFSKEIRDAIKTDKDKSRENCSGLVIKRASSHLELAKLICDHELLFYAGDREIVRENIENISREREGGCSYELSPETYTDERYAILTRVPADDEAGKAAYMLQFNQILADLILTGSILEQSFRRSFSTEPTVKLKMLFWTLTLETP